MATFPSGGSLVHRRAGVRVRARVPGALGAGVLGKGVCARVGMTCGDVYPSVRAWRGGPAGVSVVPALRRS